MATVHQVLRSVRRRLLRAYRKTRDHATALRMLVCLKLLEKLSKAEVARNLGLAPSSVSRISDRFEEDGIEGLYDRRVFNGPLKVDEGFKRHLALILREPPTPFRWQRTTRTREMLCMQMEHDGFARVAVCTMGRALYEIGARLKAPKPIVRCPWPANRRKQRLTELRDLVERTPASEPVYYSDEVDIHLNPRIGRDWMPRGHRRVVVTPGRNRKHHLAGALAGSRSALGPTAQRRCSRHDGMWQRVPSRSAHGFTCWSISLITGPLTAVVTLIDVDAYSTGACENCFPHFTPADGVVKTRRRGCLQLD
jgi:hypothetical protein